MHDLLQRLFGKDDRIRGYAQAVVSVAEAEGALDRVSDELFGFSKAVDLNPQLRQALTDQGLPAENRKAVVHEVLGDRAHPATINLVSFLIESERARDLARIAEGVVAIAAERRAHVPAEVRSAVPLSEAQTSELARALSRATGKEVDVKVVVDPSVIGGVVAKVGDEVFDGSVRARLDDAKRAFGS
jgi:F-type H+-transporting ATPase subunit delta